MGFPELLKNLRKARKISQKQLGAGLSTGNSLISRIESGEYQTDKMTRELLIGRLGYSTEGFEEFLRPEEHEIWLERQNVLRLLAEGAYEEATQANERYGALLTDNDKIASQFYLVMQASLGRLKKKERSVLHSIYEEALHLTMSSDDVSKLLDLPLSAQEINILLEYVYTSGKPEDEKINLLHRLLNYVQHALFEPILVAKIQPKITYYLLFLYRNRVNESSQLSMQLQICEKAIELLRDAKRSFYAIELLEMDKYLLSRTSMYENEKANQERLQQIEAWKYAISHIYEEYGLSTKMRHDGYLYNETEVYSIGEIVRRRRKMLGLTQEMLAEQANVGKATIYRIEKNDSHVQKETLKMVFDILKLPEEAIMRDVITYDPAVFSLLSAYRGAIFNHEYDTASDLLYQIEEIIPMDHVFNQQYLKRARSNIGFKRNQLGNREYQSHLIDALELTIPLDSIFNCQEIFLTKSEFHCLHNLVSYLESSGEDISDYLHMFQNYFQQMEQDGVIGSYINLYEFIMVLTASALGNSGSYDQSNHISNRVIPQSLMRYRLASVYVHLHNLYWNDNRQHLSSKRDQMQRLSNCIVLANYCKRERDEVYFKTEYYGNNHSSISK